MKVLSPASILRSIGLAVTFLAPAAVFCESPESADGWNLGLPIVHAVIDGNSDTADAEDAFYAALADHNGKVIALDLRFMTRLKDDLSYELREIVGPPGYTTRWGYSPKPEYAKPDGEDPEASGLIRCAVGIGALSNFRSDFALEFQHHHHNHAMASILIDNRAQFPFQGIWCGTHYESADETVENEDLLTPVHVRGHFVVSEIPIPTAYSYHLYPFHPGPVVPRDFFDTGPDEESDILAVGYSGLAQLESRTYLFVQDIKDPNPGPRLGLLKIDAEGQVEQEPILIDDWKDDDGLASDLESACVLPGAENELLLAEASYFRGKYGRIFHIQLDGDSAKVLGIDHLPPSADDGDDAQEANYEGMTCFEKEGKVFVVLGERGGTAAHPAGFLRIGVLTAPGEPIDWDTFKAQPIRIQAPEQWAGSQLHRSISDLFLDNEGIIWAVGTVDPDEDSGPFRSVIYRAATIVGTDSGAPIEALETTTASWIVDGFKVEGLSGPPDSEDIPGSVMSFGTEDEQYPGAWRPLYNPMSN